MAKEDTKKQKEQNPHPNPEEENEKEKAETRNNAPVLEAVANVSSDVRMCVLQDPSGKRTVVPIDCVKYLMEERGHNLRLDMSEGPIAHCYANEFGEEPIATAPLPEQSQNLRRTLNLSEMD